MRSLPHRVLNRVGDPFRHSVSFADEELLRQAQQRTGLDDWGDAGFREGLHQLLGSLEREAQLSFVGRLLTRREIIHALTKRLRVQNQLTRHPEIARVELKRPIFITGLPRTGTTLLHRLLAQDPGSRTLQLWELIDPTPPPRLETYATDPRRRRLARRLTAAELLLYSRQGRFRRKAIHPRASHLPEECWPLFLKTFHSEAFALLADVGSYLRWLDDHDHTAAYLEYRQQLQLLTWRCPAERLVLKAPQHLRHLQTLFSTFPDGDVIWLHRQPREAVPSACSLLAAVRRSRSDAVDPRQIGDFVLDLQAENVRRATAAREAAPGRCLLDIGFGDLVRDPIGAVRGIYRARGETLSADAEEKMQRWLVRDRRSRRGEHRYTAADFGLSAERIDQVFDSYRRRHADAMNP